MLYIQEKVFGKSRSSGGIGGRKIQMELFTLLLGFDGVEQAYWSLANSAP